MKISFEELLGRDKLLHHEIFRSISNEAMELGVEKKEHDVKILINGIPHEPKFLEDILNRLEVYIAREAQSKFESDLHTVATKLDRLSMIVDEAKNKIKDEFKVSHPYDVDEGDEG
jgi:TFIIF-interacting CTD phosphatase-like protein